MEYHIIAGAAMSGLIISLYLLRQKKGNKKIFCPLGDQCNEVLYSEYAKIFGIQTLILGAVYYCTLLAFVGVSWWIPGSIPPWSLTIVTAMSFIAVLFSLYQTIIQFFKLKKWCSWCLTSTVLNIIIAITLLVG